jgi:hypothetical protein
LFLNHLSQAKPRLGLGLIESLYSRYRRRANGGPVMTRDLAPPFDGAFSFSRVAWSSGAAPAPLTLALRKLADKSLSDLCVLAPIIDVGPIH